MKFTKSHEWYHNKRVGISKYAQEELGEIVYIEFPKVGQHVKAGEEIAVLESTKAAADIYSPVSGIVKNINEKLKEDVNLINISPEDKGFIFEIEPIDPKEEQCLLTAQNYTLLVQG